MTIATNPVLDLDVEAPPRPTAPAKFLVYRTSTKEIVDVRLPGEETVKAPKGCTIGPVAPGGVRTAASMRHVEPWPADEA